MLNFQQIWESSMTDKTFEEYMAGQTAEFCGIVEKRGLELITETRLRELRVRSGKTQLEVAENMGITQPAVRKIELEGRDIRLSTLQRYLSAIGATAVLQIRMRSGERISFPV